MSNETNGPNFTIKEIYERVVGAITARVHSDEAGYELVVRDLRGSDWMASAFDAACIVAADLAGQLAAAHRCETDDVLRYLGSRVQGGEDE